MTLEADRICTRDREVWTSAGITAGIDLSLAMIEADMEANVARSTAQQLVVHQRRPGGQSQFSALVELGGASGRFADLMDWMRAHLPEALTVRAPSRASRPMSPRNFARAFTGDRGPRPPTRWNGCGWRRHEPRWIRVRPPSDRIAEAVGFHDPERMRRAFLRAFGQPPQALLRVTR